MRRWQYFALSVLLLLPVYWQPRVQADDLSRHLDNAWLPQFIESGHAQGMVMLRQTTNLLFDLLLNGLFRVFGAELAQRLAVSLAVMVFVWGAFRFVSVAGGAPAWHLLPCLAMLAYGWVFHMGFFNFYLGMGLCFWALAAAWEWRPRRAWWTVPLLALAYLAHALPVVWTLALLLYQWLARRMSPQSRIYITAGWLAGLVILQLAIGRLFFAKWSPAQIKMVTGADQVWVFDTKYYAILIGLLLLWSLLFLDLLKNTGARGVMFSVPFQFCVISAAAVLILPATVLLPGSRHTLVYIAERMSLGVGVCVCALLAAARPHNLQRYAMGLVAFLFFAFLYRDEKLSNALSTRIDGVISRLPHRPVPGGVENQ
ncbi:MAG: hypothetical protein ABI759_18195 [Candidatus Solibacter sp.]